MPLTPEQRGELEALGAATVRVKLVQAGAGRWTTLVGFKTGEDGKGLTRGDVEDWLIEKAKKERLVESKYASLGKDRRMFCDLWRGFRIGSRCRDCAADLNAFRFRGINHHASHIFVKTCRLTTAKSIGGNAVSTKPTPVYFLGLETAPKCRETIFAAEAADVETDPDCSLRRTGAYPRGEQRA